MGVAQVVGVRLGVRRERAEHRGLVGVDVGQRGDRGAAARGARTAAGKTHAADGTRRPAAAPIRLAAVEEPASRRARRTGTAAAAACADPRVLPAPPAAGPSSRTRRERFDELVLDIVTEIDARWQDRLGLVEYAVEDTPADPRRLGRRRPSRCRRWSAAPARRRPGWCSSAGRSSTAARPAPTSRRWCSPSSSSRSPSCSASTPSRSTRATPATGLTLGQPGPHLGDQAVGARSSAAAAARRAAVAGDQHRCPRPAVPLAGRPRPAWPLGQLETVPRPAPTSIRCSATPLAGRVRARPRVTVPAPVAPAEHQPACGPSGTSDGRRARPARRGTTWRQVAVDEAARRSRSPAPVTSTSRPTASRRASFGQQRRERDPASTACGGTTMSSTPSGAKTDVLGDDLDARRGPRRRPGWRARRCARRCRAPGRAAGCSVAGAAWAGSQSRGRGAGAELVVACRRTVAATRPRDGRHVERRARRGAARCSRGRAGRRRAPGTATPRSSGASTSPSRPSGVHVDDGRPGVGVDQLEHRAVLGAGADAGEPLRRRPGSALGAAASGVAEDAADQAGSERRPRR